MKTSTLLKFSLVLALAAADARPQEKAAGKSPTPGVKAHVMMTPTDLKWGDGPPSLPKGAKMAVIEGDPKVANALFTIRLKLPANYKVMPHTHPADEHVTVISGTFMMGMGEKFDPAP